MEKIKLFQAKMPVLVRRGIHACLVGTDGGDILLLVPQSVSVEEGGMGDAPPGLGMMGVPGGPPPPGGP